MNKLGKRSELLARGSEVDSTFAAWHKSNARLAELERALAAPGIEPHDAASLRIKVKDLRDATQALYELAAAAVRNP